VVASEAGPYARLGAPVVADRLAGRGAPGGVHAALSSCTTPWLFAAGCDMPFLSEEPIRWLAARRAGAPAVMVRWRGHLEPLHAFWSRECLPELERLMARGAPSLAQVALAIGARVVEEPEWREVDPLGRAFENVNTPADAARLGLETYQE
jgi:molybdopterin-guanine dinucleotide biosynthesis protein A